MSAPKLASDSRPPLARCRVVLVRPQFPGNVGSVARVMRNLGLSDLYLVGPGVSPSWPDARRLAANAQGVLDQARTVADLGDALADCVLVVGTSARTGGLFRRQTVGTPEEIAPKLVESLADGPVALVFGPEASGLTDEEVTRCHALLHIPTDDAYAALNLAQAVAICVYELRRAWLATSGTPPEQVAPAPFADLEQMLGQLQQALEDIHFLYEPKGATLLHALRHLLGRARPTPMEVNVLRGLARQIRWFAANHPRDSVGDSAV